MGSLILGGNYKNAGFACVSIQIEPVGMGLWVFSIFDLAIVLGSASIHMV